MRILQIIDSLEAGGAERMAVNYANALADTIDFSGLVASRKEGPLLNQINNRVSYLYLNKKGTIDLKALFRLRKFVIKNNVEIIHAHSTSFFLAFLLKLLCPAVKLIWHEHYGARANQSSFNNLVLLFSSFFFSSVFVVNHELESWVKKTLLTKKVSYMSNFAIFDLDQPKVTVLKGNEEKRIVCLANLKNPKNHISLLHAFEELKLFELGWSVHLVGKDYKDLYSDELKDFIDKHNLKNSVFIYDSQNDIQNILSQATLGVLCSLSEGFPVTLLEYGLAKLPVISTNVGYCSEIIKNNFSGLLFSPYDHLELQEQLQKMILDKELRNSFGLHLYEMVLEKYSTQKVIQILLREYSKIQKQR